MKNLTEKLEDLKTEAQKILMSHLNEDGELHFSERTLSLADGGFREDTYIDEDDIYKLSAEFICDLADELLETV